MLDGDNAQLGSVRGGGADMVVGLMNADIAVNIIIAISVLVILVDCVTRKGGA